MARPDRNKKVNKTEFDLDSFLETEGLDDGVRFKEDSWLVLSEAFHDAVKLPGFPRGYVSMIRGFSCYFLSCLCCCVGLFISG